MDNAPEAYDCHRIFHLKKFHPVTLAFSGSMTTNMKSVFLHDFLHLPASFGLHVMFKKATPS
jgi:hypothetical protein